MKLRQLINQLLEAMDEVGEGADVTIVYSPGYGEGVLVADVVDVNQTVDGVIEIEGRATC